ncbi:MAG: 3-hydroxyacyl-ACP dehydratase [Bacteroidota bacterium]
MIVNIFSYFCRVTVVNPDQMLAGSFYDILSFSSTLTERSGQELVAVCRLNPGHSIFTGHFPGNPVVPGVCQVQMVKELVEKTLEKQVRLTESDNIKFLSMISPETTPLLEFRIISRPGEEGVISVTATIVSGSTVFLKFKGKFEIERLWQKS